MCLSVNTFVKQSIFRSWLGIPGVCLVWFPADYAHQKSYLKKDVNTIINRWNSAYGCRLAEPFLHQLNPKLVQW